MNLRDLQYLVALAEHRHFGRAAEASFVSQPTLSTQIKKLETELGVELFERSSRGPMLTAAGQEIVRRAQVVLREIDDIVAIAEQLHGPEPRRLRIGAFPTLGPYLLPHVVPQLRQRFASIELQLVEEKTEELLRRLRAGELDCALLALPEDDDELVHAELFEEEFLLAVPADHPLASTTEPVELSVLDGERLLLLDEGHCLREQALDVCRLAGANERVGFRATSMETLRQMVAAGVGITLLPELAVRPPVAASEHVVLRRFAAPAPSRTIALFWRRTSGHAGFFPALADCIADLPDGFVRRLLA